MRNKSDYDKEGGGLYSKVVDDPDNFVASTIS